MTFDVEIPQEIIRKRGLVYMLVDPRSNLPRYIGSSKNGLGRPIGYSVSDIEKMRRKKNPQLLLADWFEDLFSNGLTYRLFIIEDDVELRVLLETEKMWMRMFKALGAPLLNVAHLEKHVKHSNRTSHLLTDKLSTRKVFCVNSSKTFASAFEAAKEILRDNGEDIRYVARAIEAVCSGKAAHFRGNVYRMEGNK